ncbi:substrate-binding periplasmic protein [Arsukibacterium sp.]|uniref:substrate-binding periplasmic protein n=1 Tax=Arsukibacterium sp. TaxID=1977258 RepID=UPI002FDA5174
MRFVVQHITAVMLMCLVFSHSLPAKTPPLTFYTEHLPPYSYLEQGELKGINVELVQQLCQQLALECQFQLLPWARAFELAQRDVNSGVFSTARSPQREALFQWVGPLASDWGYLFRLRSRPEVAPVDLEQAKAFSIAVVRGDVYEQYFLRQGFKYRENLLDYSTRAESIPLFLQGRVDLIPASPLAISRWLAEYDAPPDVAEIVFKLRGVGDNYLALHPQMRTELVAQLQQALQQFVQSADYQQLLQRYLSHQAAEALMDKP